MWLAYTGLARLAANLPEETLLRHWLSDVSLADAIPLSRDLTPLERDIPLKVLGLLEDFMV